MGYGLKRLKGIQKITPRKQKMILGATPWRMDDAYRKRVSHKVSRVYKCNHRRRKK